MNAKGFTLIELVIVIVILGILSVTAAPRFLNLQDDAKNAAIDGLKGAFLGSMGIVYSKAVILGIEQKSETSLDTDANGSADLDIAYGYPKATFKDLSIVIQGLQQDWGHRTDPNRNIIYFGLPDYDQYCLKYSQANATTSATTEVVDNRTECHGLIEPSLQQ
ncbi:type II secretion system protein [Vibrio rhodolitus]|uniref:type II secretion system protein n=1 Tax=Vibrio rhodolitus TaxID=2231649 RepID=UPI000E0A22E8|nr:prepilin-type N-terminal cleavage/methylation domain-containing protein [Vibrio rhodolitus]